MTTSEKVFAILKSQTKYFSGEELSLKLNVSRTAIWKAVNKLKAQGYVIKSVTNKGYVYLPAGEPIQKEQITTLLRGCDFDVEVLDEVDSTNDYIKRYVNGEQKVVIAKRQTKGRGRFDRVFYSPENAGIYMSVLLKPNSKISNSVRLTTYAGVVVASAIEKLTGLETKIKWVNDVFINGKKVCGILTEAGYDFESQRTNYLIVGIGVNVCAGALGKELENIATDIESECGKKINPNVLISEIINGLSCANEQLESGDYLAEYKKRSLILGKIITVNEMNSSYTARALDISQTGALIVDKNGEIITVNAGDVSVRL